MSAGRNIKNIANILSFFEELMILLQIVWISDRAPQCTGLIWTPSCLPRGTSKSLSCIKWVNSEATYKWRWPTSWAIVVIIHLLKNTTQQININDIILFKRMRNVKFDRSTISWQWNTYIISLTSCTIVNMHLVI